MKICPSEGSLFGSRFALAKGAVPETRAAHPSRSRAPPDRARTEQNSPYAVAMSDEALGIFGVFLKINVHDVFPIALYFLMTTQKNPHEMIRNFMVVLRTIIVKNIIPCVMNDTPICNSRS